MAKSDVDKVTEETIEKGGILVKFYFDMQNDDKDKLQPLMTDLINNRLMKEPGMVYCYGAIEEPIKVKDTYSTVAEVTLLFDKPSHLFRVSFNYAPAGIEILKPGKDVVFTSFELQTILMDLSEISVNYSKYILEHIMNKDEINAIGTAIDNRKAVGENILKGEDDKKDNNDKN
jgi:hypothetical protein